MFAQQQIATALASRNGLIAIDEHRSVSCMIDDVTSTGLTLTLLDGFEVPSTFVLFVGTNAHVCTLVRRSEEEIVASFAEIPSVGRAASESVQTRRAAAAFGRRRFAWDRALPRAA